MPLTRNFIDTVKQRADQDPEFRCNMLVRAINYILTGNAEDINLGKQLIRDYINATLGFDEVAARTGRKKASIMRMLSPTGNPGLDNFSLIISTLLAHEGINHPAQYGIEAAE